MAFETPVLKQRFFGGGHDRWEYSDPASGISIVVSGSVDATIREVSEAVHNFRFAFAATRDHLVAVKHTEVMKQLTSFQGFNERCKALLKGNETFGGNRGPDLGDAATLWNTEKAEGHKKVLSIYKQTIDKAFLEAETFQKKKDEITVATTKTAKTLTEQTPDNFIEMKIEQGIMKELGKAKGKGGKGKHVTLDYESLADVVESSAYKFLTDQEKAQALEEYISVKRQTKGQCPRWNGGENEERQRQTQRQRHGESHGWEKQRQRQGERQGDLYERQRQRQRQGKGNGPTERQERRWKRQMDWQKRRLQKLDVAEKKWLQNAAAALFWQLVQNCSWNDLKRCNSQLVDMGYIYGALSLLKRSRQATGLNGNVVKSYHGR